MASKPASYRLKLPARTGAVPPARALLKGMLHEMGYPKAFAEDMELALDEALHNVIEHTYKFKAGREIEVLFEPKAGFFRMSIRDWGPAFNSRAIPKVDMDRYVQEKKEGGLGVLLMKRLMDRVRYIHGKKTGNTIILEKRAVRDGFIKRFRAPLKRRHIDQIRRQLSAECDAKNLPANCKTMLLSVADEICCNVMDHSGANWLEVGLQLQGQEAVFKASDDGVAFDPVEAAGYMDEPLIEEGVDRHLGLFMLSRMKESLSYRRHAGVNEFTFTQSIEAEK